MTPTDINKVIADRYIQEQYGISLDALEYEVLANQDSKQEENEYIETQLDLKGNIINRHEMMNIHNELQLLGTAQFAETLHTRVVDGKLGVYSLDDKVKLGIYEGKIIMQLGDAELKGGKKLAVIKHLLETVGWENHYESNGWNSFTIKLNDRLYNVGYLIDQPNACYMSVKRDQTSKEYYDAYYKQRSSGWRRPTNVSLTDDQYGDHASGLGSIFTDNVKAELEEINAYIQTVMNDDMYKDEIEMLRVTLDISKDV